MSPALSDLHHQTLALLPLPPPPFPSQPLSTDQDMTLLLLSNPPYSLTAPHTKPSKYQDQDTLITPPHTQPLPQPREVPPPAPPPTSCPIFPSSLLPHTPPYSPHTKPSKYQHKVPLPSHRPSPKASTTTTSATPGPPTHLSKKPENLGTSNSNPEERGAGLLLDRLPRQNPGERER